MTTLLQQPGGTELTESSVHLGRHAKALRCSLPIALYHARQTSAVAFRLALGIVFTVISLCCGLLIYAVVILSVPLAPFLILVALVIGMIVAGLMIANAEIVLLFLGLLWSVAHAVTSSRA